MVLVDGPFGGGALGAGKRGTGWAMGAPDEVDIEYRVILIMIYDAFLNLIAFGLSPMIFFKFTIQHKFQHLTGRVVIINSHIPITLHYDWYK